MPNRSPLRMLLLSGSLAFGGLAGATLVGCDKSDEALRAVRNAADKLASLGTNPHVTPISEKREATLREVLKSLEPHTSSSSAALAGAANLLASRAQAGLADVKATQATDLERQTQNNLSSLQAKAEGWFNQSMRAHEAEAYDPSKELAALDKSASETEAAIAAAATAQRQAEERVSAFNREADTVLGRAKAKHDEAVKIKQGMGDGTATQGLTLLERSAAVAREADALDMQVSEIRGKAYAARPAVDDAVRSAELLKSRRDSIAKLKDSVTKRAQDAKTRAAEAKTAAQVAAGEINDMVKDMATFRSGELAAAYDAAVKGYRDALASAKKAMQGATGDSRSTAALTVAAHQQSLADVLLVRGRGAEAYAAMLKTLAGTLPPLPNKAQLDGMIREQADAAQALVTEAKEAYGAARDAYQSAGAKAEAERIDRLARMLGEMAGAAPSSEALEAASTDEAAPAAAVPTDDAAEVAAIRKTLEDFSAAIESGNTMAAMGFFFVEGEEQEKAFNEMVTPLLNLSALDAALRSKFSAGLSDMMPVPTGPAGSPFAFKVAELEIKITAPGKATAKKPGGEGVELTKAGDRWLLAIPAEALAAAGPMKDALKGLGEAAAELTADVRAGKFKTKDEFQAALMKKMMSGIKPPAAPPGGGG